MKKYSALITNVYDGDTVTADIDLGFGVMLTKQKLRLSRVKAPEIRGPERSKGLKSRNALRKKIDKKWVILESDGKSKGKYGRWLVSLYIDGFCVNDWLIDSKLADLYE